MKPTITTLTTALFILAALAGPALGATIYVPADQPTIQAGIDAASDGDTVVVAWGTYVENIDFLGKAITVKGLALFGNPPVIDGNQAGSVVTFASGETEDAVLDGFKITNGESTGCGGIYCDWGSSPTIMNCTITNNHTGYYGGGIKCADSFPIITNCTISGNIADFSGGGIFCTFGASPIIANCTISGNSCNITGGGIEIVNWGTHPTIMNCTISGNHAGQFGGGITCSIGNATITNCTVSENSAGEGGGAFAIANTHSEAYITNCILWGNSAPEGPEIVVGYNVGALQDAELTVTYSDVQGGEAAALVMDPNCTLYWGAGNIDVIPLFLGGGDYHLSPGSPCIDAGSASSMYDDDCFPPSLGTTRNDMGAYGGPLGCDWIPCPDADGDGFHDQVCGGTDCDDTDPDMHPDAAETCGNGIDDDCDGLIDTDDPECQDCPLAAGTWLLDLSWEKSTVIATFHLYPFATVEYSSGVSGTWSWAGCSVEWSIESMGMFTEYWGVMDPGGQTMEGEMVSPYGTAGTWSAMRMELTFDLAASYESGLLSLDFSLGTPEPSVWSTYLVVTSPSIYVIPIWTISLPTIYPPLDVPISFPLPSMGWVGVYTTITLDSGEETYDLEWVDTGW